MGQDLAQRTPPFFISLKETLTRKIGSKDLETREMSQEAVLSWNTSKKKKKRFQTQGEVQPWRVVLRGGQS